MTIKELLDWGMEELKRNNISEPENSAILLLTGVLGKDRAYIYAHGEQGLTNKQLKIFRRYIKRRKSHEPVWYILGEVEFYGRKFLVNNNVLTPRPETEILVREVLKTINNNQLAINNIIEVGTGSGAIIVSLAKEFSNKKIKIIATDISKKALKVAKKNAKMHRINDKIEFLCGDLLEPIKNLKSLLRGGKFKTKNSIVVANLPYVPHEDMESLQFDILHHEPRIALDGGKDGVEIYERLLKQMKELGFSGAAFFEIGTGQGKLIKKIVQKYFSKFEIEIKKDLAGIDRVAIISINN